MEVRKELWKLRIYRLPQYIDLPKDLENIEVDLNPWHIKILLVLEENANNTKGHPQHSPRRQYFFRISLTLENDQLTTALCNISEFFVVEVKALIIVDSGKKLSLVFQVPQNAPDSPCSGKFFSWTHKGVRQCQVNQPCLVCLLHTQENLFWEINASEITILGDNCDRSRKR